MACDVQCEVDEASHTVIGAFLEGRSPSARRDGGVDGRRSYEAIRVGIAEACRDQLRRGFGLW